MTQRHKPDSCHGCSCESHGSDFSQVEGTGSSGCMLVGEASGEMEARDQLPFRPYAPAGSVLERVIRRMGLTREMFSITNVLRCRPRNNWLEKAPWEHSALAHCRPNLDAAIASRRPRSIQPLGGIATRELTGLAGEKLGVSYLAGYVLPGPSVAAIPSYGDPNPVTSASPIAAEFGNSGVAPVVPNFHPAYLRRGKASHQGVFARILQRALNVAAGKDRSWMWGVNPEDPSTWGRKRYILRPSLDDFISFRNRVYDNLNIPVAEDLETPESASMDEDAREGFKDTEVRQAQFSMGADEGWAVPWEEPYRSVAIDIFHSPNRKYGHNWDNYDHKVLRAAAAREGWRYAPTVRVYDTLDMFHHWQPDLPAHLQFAASFIQFPFPWKHLHTIESEPFYGCVDVDSDWQLGEMLVRTLQRDGIWGDSSVGYLGQCYEVRPILAQMEDRGMPIDDAARVALGAEFDTAQSQLGAELAALAPASCCRVHPKEGYKGVPPEVKNFDKTQLGGPDGGERVTEHRFEESGDDPEFYHYELRSFTVPVIDAASGEPAVTPATRWCRVYDFNPNSRDQVIDYMKAKGHPVPKDKHRENDKGENPETTIEKELRRLAARTNDPFYLKVVEYRGFTKLRRTYIDGFLPGPDGRVHTTFTFDTGIGQLSSRNPNVQNFPKLKPTPVLAHAMRRMVAAERNHLITEWDFKSCHVITLGFLAEDLNYMRLGRLDIHSFVAGHFLNLWDGLAIFGETDAELLARFKSLKSNPPWKHVRDDQAKHGILGIGNGLKAKGLYERYMESFPNRDCPQCQGTRKVPGVRGPKKCPACQGSGFELGSRTAQKVLEIAEHLFPKVFEHQKREVKLAHDARELKTAFGHIRRFYEVLRWDSQRCDWGPGDQHEEAIAYRLANIAFGHIREKLKQLYQMGLDNRYGLFNNIHDSFLFSFPEELLEQHVKDIYPVLTSPSTVLKHPSICPDGLVIDVEGSWGRNWGDMQEIDLEDLRMGKKENSLPVVLGEGG